jgi:hypothetical protein
MWPISALSHLGCYLMQLRDFGGPQVIWKQLAWNPSFRIQLWGKINLLFDNVTKLSLNLSLERPYHCDGEVKAFHAVCGVCMEYVSIWSDYCK